MLLGWLLCISVARAEPAILDSANSRDLTPHTRLYQATDNIAVSPFDDVDFYKQLQPVAEISRRGGIYWIQLQLENHTHTNNWTFAHFGSYIEQIDIYVWNGMHYQHLRTGQIEANDYPMHSGADVKLEPRQRYTVWLRYASPYFSQKPTVGIIPTTDFHREVYIENLLIAGCLGAIIILAAYNLLLYFWTRSPDYFFYSVYLLITVVGWSSVFKITLQTFGFNSHDILFGAFTFNIVTNTFFYLYFLDLRKNQPRLARAGMAVAVIALCAGIINPWLPPWINYLNINILSGLWLSIGLLGGILSLQQGFKPARFFIAGFVAMFISGGLVILSYLDIIRVHQKEYLITLIFQAVDAVLLGIALADRINTLRKENADALKYALDTDQKANAILLQANKKLHDALQQAEDNQRKKDEFIMAVSHELRTPLHAITASLDQLKVSVDEREKNTLYDFIQFGSDRLSSQVENLIMLAETDHVSIQPNPRLFFIAGLLERIRRLAESHMFNKSVKFAIEFTGEKVNSYLGDDYLLQRMIVPLLENACKYTEKGQVKLTLDCHANHLSIYISDTGPGITPELQQRIFDSFTQGSIGYQRSHEGLGIGLTVAQRIATILGTQIQLESTPGQGSCFYFQVAMTAQTAQQMLDAGRLHGHVLVAEDNDVNARVLLALLKKLGLTTELASNGRLAVEASERSRFDLVLMDLQMPEMDGFAATRIMRKQGLHCPIIAITANSDYQARMHCWEAGMNDILSKPARRETLHNALAYWLQQSGTPANSQWSNNAAKGMS